MHIVLTIIALVIVGVGIFVGRTDKTNYSQNIDLDRQVLSSEEESSDVEKQEKNQPSVNQETISQPTPTTPLPTSTVAPTPKTQGSIADYQYPDAQLISSSGSLLLLTSSENPDVITDWYKERIKNDGMNVKSFVTTKTNNNVLNKLVGSSGGKEVSVEIKKDSGAAVTSISVNIKFN